MSDILSTLRELELEDGAYITLKYTEGADVWHINESHVEETVAETSTASMLARLLASPAAVYTAWGDTSEGNDILNDMRAQDALDDYDREGWFEEYLTDLLVQTIYEGEYGLEHSTTQYDYKRGRCDISTTVRILVSDLEALADVNENLYTLIDADTLVSGFEVSVETPKGTLTLN